MRTKLQYALLGIGLVASAGCNRLDELLARARGSADAAATPTTAAAEATTGTESATAHPREPAAQRAHAPTNGAAITDGGAPGATANANGEDPATNAGNAAAPTALLTGDGGTPNSPEAAVAAAPAEPPGATMTALWIWVPIYDRMDMRGPRVGYMRAGAHVTVEPEATGTIGCPRGWYAVRGGGYICLNRMTTLETASEVTRRLPTQPDLSRPMPYNYYVTYRAAVMYRWLPSVADMREVEPSRFGVTPPGAIASLDGGLVAPTSNTTTSANVTPAVLSTTAPVTGDPGGGTDAGARNSAAMTVANRAQAEDAGVRIEDLAGEAGSPLLRRMLSGMYVSVDREAGSAGRGFWRTQNGGYIERGAVSRVSTPPTFQGVVIDEQHPLPMAFMSAYQGWTYDVSPDGASATRREQAPRLTAYSLASDEPVRVGRMEFYRTREGVYLNARQVRVVRTSQPLVSIGPTEKWIEVNLDRQMLVAYEGPRPVYVTLVSTGRRNDHADDRNYETVQGEFRIQSKHVATTMDGNSAGDGPYSIEDVPWVMYFENSFALHGAFWHNGFGFMHSHGCVNMSPPDARWIFNWTEPALPQGWHGVYSTPNHPGTRVFVRYERQELGMRGGPAVVPHH